MTKAQIRMFENLLQDENFQGKKQLRHLLWLNTSKPKFKVGDCFRINGTSGHKVYGVPVRDFAAKVVNVYSWKDEEAWHYELEMVVRVGDKETISKEYISESVLSLRPKCKDNINVLQDPKSDVTDQIDM